MVSARPPRPSSARPAWEPARPRSDLEGLGLARLSSPRFGPACLDSDWLGLAQPGRPRSDRLGPAWLEAVWGLIKLFLAPFPDGLVEGKKLIIDGKTHAYDDDSGW